MFVPNDFGKWDSMRQTEFIQEKINNTTLDIINFSLGRKNDSES